MPDDEAASRVIWALRRAFLEVERRKDELMRGHPVSPAQYAVLINVDASPGLTAAELARRLQVSPQNVAVLSSGLLERGLLERRAHAQHGHVRELYLTGAGRNVLAEADAVVTELENQVRDHLGPGATEQLRGLLDRLAGLPVTHVGD